MEKPRLTLVVLAAGIGSRYGGLKQLDPIGPGGELIIDYSVYDALRAGFNKVVFVISEAIAEAFHERIGRTIERQCETAYVFQRLEDVPPGCEVPPGRKKPWGTAQATLCTRQAVDSPFAVINADDFYGLGAYQAVAGFLSNRPEHNTPDYCMVGYRLGNTLSEHGHVARGVCTVDAAGYLVRIDERTRIEPYGASARYFEDSETWTELPLDAVVSMNIWGLNLSVYPELAERFPRFLSGLVTDREKAEYYLPTFVGDLLRDQRARVKVLTTNEKWYGVTYAQDKPKVKAALHALVSQGLYPERLWENRG